MSLTLTRFSQEVDVGSGSLDVTYFALFRSDDGRELKMPISQEASQTIIAFFADKTEKKAEVRDPDEEQVPYSADLDDDIAGAAVFGGEEDQEPEDESYQSEEQVPSL